MTYILYYLLDDYGKIELTPRLFKCKDFLEGVRLQNNLTHLGFKCNLITLKEDNKDE